MGMGIIVGYKEAITMFRTTLLLEQLLRDDIAIIMFGFLLSLYLMPSPLLQVCQIKWPQMIQYFPSSSKTI